MKNCRPDRKTESAKVVKSTDENQVPLSKCLINGERLVLKPPLALCNKPGVPPVFINAQRLC